MKMYVTFLCIPKTLIFECTGDFTTLSVRPMLLKNTNCRQVLWPSLGVTQPLPTTKVDKMLERMSLNEYDSHCRYIKVHADLRTLGIRG